MPNLERREAEYLLELYRVAEAGGRTSTGALAKRFRVKPPSAVEVLRRLEDRGLVKRSRWRHVELSMRGEPLARRLIHRHRVLETFFHRELRLEPAASCREAAKIDYIISDDVVNRLCSSLGYPSRCVHGRPLIHVDCQ